MNIWGEREETEEEVLLSFQGGDNEDYSSDDGNEAKEDSTREDHDAEEEDTLADSTMEMRKRPKSHAHSSDSTSRDAAYPVFATSVCGACIALLTPRECLGDICLVGDGGRTVDPLFCQCFPCSCFPCVLPMFVLPMRASHACASHARAAPCSLLPSYGSLDIKPHPRGHLQS